MKHRKREPKLDLSLRTRAQHPRRNVIRTGITTFLAFSTLLALNTSFAVDAPHSNIAPHDISIQSGNNGALSSNSHPAGGAGNTAQHGEPNQIGEVGAPGAAGAHNEAAVDGGVGVQDEGQQDQEAAANTPADRDGAPASSPQGEGNASHRAPTAEQTGPQDPAGASTSSNSGEENAESRPSGYSGFFQARRPSRVSSTPNDPSILPAVFASGGQGKHKERIQWLQWADYDTHFRDNPRPNVPILRAGETRVIKNYRDFGDAGYLLTTCTLADLQYHTRGVNVPESQAHGPLVATVPGTWAGDILDNLYNIGGSGRWTSGREERSEAEIYPNDYSNKNRMVIGLANGYAYNGSGVLQGQSSFQTGYSSDVEFNIDCSAALHPKNGNPIPVPLEGLVFADAEASSKEKDVWDNSIPGWRHERGEWIQAYAWGANTRWRLLDSLRGSNCPDATTYAAFHEQGSTRLLRLAPSGDECVYRGGDYERPAGIGGPGAIMFMEGSSGASIRMQGSGYSAVALGLVINTDFGDAPRSYGLAGSLYQPRWEGGEPRKLSDDAHIGEDLLRLRTARPVAGKSHLGQRIDAELHQGHHHEAAYDDSTGELPSDEDALNATTLRTRGISVSLGEKHQMVVPCRGPGKVAGWIDWDRNGQFHINTERSNIVECTGSSVTLEWRVPFITKRSVSGEPGNSANTFMRLRIADVQNDSEMRPTGVTTAGEVEDYELRVYVPTITLKKHVNSQWGDEIKAGRWKLTARDEVGSGIGHELWGYGDTVEWPVTTKNFTLKETSDHSAASGYEAGKWSCREASGTINQPGYSYSTVLNGDVLQITGPDRIYCEITNTAKPASVSWEKTNKATGEHIGGSVWVLHRSGIPTDIVVEDCESGTCTGLDKDNRPGYFKATPLKWGWYTLTERTAPPGFIKDTRTQRFQNMLGGIVDVSLPAPIPNTPTNTTVIWRKVDASGQGRTLSGAQWRLERQGGATIAIPDCVATNQQACTGIDKDHRGGYFRILTTEAGRYTLTETVAPIGYHRNTQPLVRNISAQDLGSQIDLGAIANTAITPPALPFTGGASADAFLFVGGGALGSAAIAAAYRRRQQSVL